MNTETIEQVERCVKAQGQARFAASGLLGDIVQSQTAKILSGQPFGENDIALRHSAWIAENIAEAIRRFVEAAERESVKTLPNNRGDCYPTARATFFYLAVQRLLSPNDQAQRLATTANAERKGDKQNE